MKSIFKILIFTFFISFVFGEFELMKKSRGYAEAVDYLTIKIRGTNCVEFLKIGGLSERIRGGYSHHCLPIDSRGNDVDDLKFIGRCLNHNKDIVVSIFDIQRKREFVSKSSIKPKRNNKNHPMRKKKHIRDFEGPPHHEEEAEDSQFYLRLEAKETPIQFKVKHFNLKKGHVHQARRPHCIKARNFCPNKKKEEREELMVIDCEANKLAEGFVGSNEVVYLEVTKREEAPDTCFDKKNGYCCRYVNNEVKGGICEFFQRGRGQVNGLHHEGEEHLEPNNNEEGKKKEASDPKTNLSSENKEDTPQENDKKEIPSPDEEEVEMEEVIEEDGPLLGKKDDGNDVNSEKKSAEKTNKKEKPNSTSEQTETSKKEESEENGEEIDLENISEEERSLLDPSKEKRKTSTSNNKNNNHKNDSNDEFDIFEDDLEETPSPLSNSTPVSDSAAVVEPVPKEIVEAEKTVVVVPSVVQK